MNTPLLYLCVVAIWGTTWIAITYELGPAAPTTSVMLRFGLASLLLLAWCLLRKIPLKLSREQHLRVAAQGACLFGVNLLLMYYAEQLISSGVVSVIFTSLVPFNLIGGRLIFGTPITGKSIAGAAFGVCGILLVFYPEFGRMGSVSNSLAGLAFALGGTAVASVGNLMAARNQKAGIPILQSNAWGMGYGAVSVGLVGLALGNSFHVAWNLSYSLGLAYLAVFGSILAFGAYLLLIRRIGPGPAAYTGVLFPLVALAISTFREGYRWNVSAVIGMLFCVGGSILMNLRFSKAKA